ncbi:MAG: hypothetical protein ACFFER_20455, partial [Candidatus Thorarchaeota archaeon]
VWRIKEKYSPDALGLMRRGEIDIIINTPTIGSGPRRDGNHMRRLAVELVIPFITTMPAASAAIEAIKSAKKRTIDSGINDLRS